MDLSSLQHDGFTVRELEPRPPWRGYPGQRQHTPKLAERNGSTYYATALHNHRFHEILIARQVDLPHVAKVALLKGGVLLTEFIDGTTLWELPAGDRPSLQCVREMLCELVEALIAADLVHGDLRPWNILYRSSDNAFFVIDWCYGFERSKGPSGAISKHLSARGHQAPFDRVDYNDSCRIVEALRAPSRAAELWHTPRLTWAPAPWR